MEIEEICKTIITAIIENTEQNITKVAPEDNLVRLGMNSLYFVQLVVLLEETYSIEFEEEKLDMNGYNSIKDLALYVKQIAESNEI